MKNITSLLEKKHYFASLAVLFSMFLITNCRNEDDTNTEPQYYTSTTDYYGKSPDSIVIRNAVVGKWYDEKNNLILDINKGYQNPEFPYIIVNGLVERKSFYSYDIISNIEGYTFKNYQKIERMYWYKNNVNLGGMFHLIVEGNNAYLWVIRNQPYKIKVVKK